MANRFARKTGNWDAVDVWSDTPTGTAGAQFIPVSGDVAMANSFTVTINVNATCLEIRNDATGGATATGRFTLSDGITLTANLIGGPLALSTYSGTVSIIGNITGGYSYGATSTTSGSILILTGNVTGGTGSYAHGINKENTGSVTINGNITGGTAVQACGISSSAPITVTGNVFGGGPGVNSHGIQASNSISVTGNVTGGSSGWGIRCMTSAVATVIGDVTGGPGFGTYGIVCEGSSTLSVTGNVLANVGYGISSSSTGAINITGNVTGNTGYGADHAGVGIFTVNGNVSGSISGIGGYGIRNRYAASTVTVNGNVYGGTTNTAIGIYNHEAGIVNITGDVIAGNGLTANGFNGNHTGTLTILGYVVSNNYPNDGIVNANAGIYLTGNGTAKIGGMKTGTGGIVPIDGPIAQRRVFFATGGVQAAFLYDANQGNLVSLSNVDSDHPAITDVRAGTAYYQGNRIGTLAVPPPAAVGVGVPVDNTVGQAALTQADIAAVIGPIWSAG